MAINWPNTPTDGQRHTEQGQTWAWNATAGVWVIVAGTDAEFLPISGGTLTGPLIASDSLTVNNGFVSTDQATFQGAVQLDLGATSKDELIIDKSGDKGITFQDGAGATQGRVGWISAGIALIHNTVTKLITTATGVTITEDLQVDGNANIAGTTTTQKLDVTGSTTELQVDSEIWIHKQPDDNDDAQLVYARNDGTPAWSFSFIADDHAFKANDMSLNRYDAAGVFLDSPFRAGDYGIRCGSNEQFGQVSESGASFVWDTNNYVILDGTGSNARVIWNAGSGQRTLTLGSGGTITFPGQHSMNAPTVYGQTVNNSAYSYTSEYYNNFGRAGYIRGRHVVGYWVGMTITDGKSGHEYSFRGDGYGYANSGWTTTSDASLKENIRPLKAALGVDALQAIEAIQTGHYTRTDVKGYDGSEIKQVGLIADSLPSELQLVVQKKGSEKSTDTPGKFDGTYDKDIMGYEYGSVIALLIEANKELKARIEILESQAK